MDVKAAAAEKVTEEDPHHTHIFRLLIKPFYWEDPTHLFCIFHFSTQSFFKLKYISNYFISLAKIHFSSETI